MEVGLKRDGWLRRRREVATAHLVLRERVAHIVAAIPAPHNRWTHMTPLETHVRVLAQMVLAPTLVGLNLAVYVAPHRGRGLIVVILVRVTDKHASVVAVTGRQR